MKLIVLIFALVAGISCNYNEFLEKELRMLHDLRGACPYCNPNYVDVPNLQSAMKGYDLPMGDPNSKFEPFANNITVLTLFI